MRDRQLRWHCGHPLTSAASDDASTRVGQRPELVRPILAAAASLLPRLPCSCRTEDGAERAQWLARAVTVSRLWRAEAESVLYDTLAVFLDEWEGPSAPVALAERSDCIRHVALYHHAPAAWAELRARRLARAPGPPRCLHLGA